MRYSICAIFVMSVFLSGCWEEKVKEVVVVQEEKVKPLQTTIDGLDLTKIQTTDYFRQRMEPSKKFMQWCVDTMIAPLPLDETTRLFNRNCQVVQHAVVFNHQKLEGSRKYKSY